MKLIAHIAGILLVSALFYWYNTIFYHVQLEYVKWIVVGVIFSLAVAGNNNEFHKSIRTPLALILLTAIILQLFKWFGWFHGTLF